MIVNPELYSIGNGETDNLAPLLDGLELYFDSVENKRENYELSIHGILDVESRKEVRSKIKRTRDIAVAAKMFYEIISRSRRTTAEAQY